MENKLDRIESLESAWMLLIKASLTFLSPLLSSKTVILFYLHLIILIFFELINIITSF